MTQSSAIDETGVNLKRIIATGIAVKLVLRGLKPVSADRACVERTIDDARGARHS